MQRALILIGLVALLAGLCWPWIGKLGLGRLPGDIVIRREHFTFYAPIATSLAISALFTLLFWLFRR